MDFQTIIVGIILTLTVAFTLRKVWQKINAFTSKNSADCGSGCGSCATEKRTEI